MIYYILEWVKKSGETDTIFTLARDKAKTLFEIAASDESNIRAAVYQISTVDITPSILIVAQYMSVL